MNSWTLGENDEPPKPYEYLYLAVISALIVAGFVVILLQELGVM